MKTHGLAVGVTDSGEVVISQTRDYGWCGEDAEIVLHPDQIDMLIKWLSETKEPTG